MVMVQAYDLGPDCSRGREVATPKLERIWATRTRSTAESDRQTLTMAQ